MRSISKQRASQPSGLGAVAAKLLARLVASGEAGLPATNAAAERTLEREELARRDGARIYASLEGLARIARESGGATGFLAQHRTLGRRTVRTETGHESLLVDLDESPLAWLARRKGRDGRPLLEASAVAAGERLRADFTRGQMSPRVTANWEAAVSSGRRGGAGAGVDVADAALSARARVSRAVEAVGPELSGVLLDVCCFLKGLEEVERDRGWPARGAKLVLGIALKRLAAHYGLTEQEKPEGRGKIRAWGAPGSRPTIDGA